MAENKYDIINRIQKILDAIQQFRPSFLIDDTKPINFSTKKSELTVVVINSSKLFDVCKNNNRILIEQSHATLLQLESAAKGMLNILIEMRDLAEAWALNNEKGLAAYELQPFDRAQHELSDKFSIAHNEFDGVTSPILFSVHLAKEKEAATDEIIDLSAGKEKEGIAEYTTLFENRISAHKDACDWWLLALIAAFVISFLYIFDLISDADKHHFEPSEYLDFIDHVSLRVILFSLIGYVIFFLSKGYRLNKNQQTLYEDKKTALESYAYFEKSNRKDPELHRAILLQVTDAIFKTHPNGYLDNSPEPSLSPTNQIVNFLELLKK